MKIRLKSITTDKVGGKDLPPFVQAAFLDLEFLTTEIPEDQKPITKIGPEGPYEAAESELAAEYHVLVFQALQLLKEKKSTAFEWLMENTLLCLCGQNSWISFKREECTIVED